MQPPMNNRIPAALLSLAVCLTLSPVAAAQLVESLEPLSPPMQAQPPIRPLVNSTEVAVAGGDARVLALGDGRRLLVARTSADDQLTARFLDADLVPTGAAFPVGPTGSLQPSAFSLTELDSGRWVLGWVGPVCDGCGENVFFSIYDGSTSVREAESVVPASFLETALARRGVAPRLAFNGSGEFAVAWTVEVEINGVLEADAVARLFDTGGAAISQPFATTDDLDGDQFMSDAAFLTNGDLVLAWEERFETTATDVFVRHFDSEGLPLAPAVVVHDSTQLLPGNREGTQRGAAIGVLDFSYIVAWVDSSRPTVVDGSGVGPPGGVLARFFSLDGEPQDEIWVTPPGAHGDFDDLAVAVDGTGSYAVQWTTACGDGPRCIEPPPGLATSGRGASARVFSLSFFGPIYVETAPFVVGELSMTDQESIGLQGLADGGYLSTWRGTSPGAAGPSTRVRDLRSGGCRELCLDDGRFEIAVHWQDFQGNQGRAVGVPRDRDWGTFWMFQESAVDLAVKVLDGTSINEHYWLYFAALSNVQYTVDAWDLETGSVARYENEPRIFASRGDVTALPASGPPPTAPVATFIEALREPGTPTWRDMSAVKSTAASPPATNHPVLAPFVVATQGPHGEAASIGPCPADAFCLYGDRFRIDVDWRDFDNGTGIGVPVRLSNDSAWFWYFDDGNPEMLVKIVDGTSLTGAFWVFYGALSNVGFELRVTDRVTGATAIYMSPIGSFAAAGDVEALPTDGR